MGRNESLGEFEQAVLLAVVHLGEDAYGVTIRREIETRTKRSIAIGALYTGIDHRRAGSGRSGSNDPGGVTIGDIYAIVGARAAAGRLPDAADDRLGAPAVAVLSYGFWREAYGGDPSISGARTLPIGSGTAEIVGALAPGVQLPGSDADVRV